MTLTQQELDSEGNRLAALRMQLLEMHPFWGYMLLQVSLLPAPQLPAYAATDAYRHIWFNPARTIGLSNEELSFVLLHLICHQVLAATARRGPREPRRWEMAIDYAINCMIEDINLTCLYQWNDFLYKRPKRALYNQKYHDWIAELIYEDLCRINTLKIVEKYDDKKDVGGDGVNIADLLPELTLTLPLAGDVEVFLPGLINHGGGIDLHISLELSQEQQESLRDRVLAAVENYQANEERGHLPDEMLRKTNLLSTGKVPWKQLLHRFAEIALGKDDYSLSHPNKRYLMHDLVVPGLYSEKPPSIVVALDTSASMSPAILSEVASEIRGLLENSDDITLIVADAKVQQVVKFDQIENFLHASIFKGGGGTDHVCVFEYIKDHKLRPSLFIGLSDLYSRFPSRPPPFPVLWVVPEMHNQPPWGKLIVL